MSLQYISQKHLRRNSPVSLRMALWSCGLAFSLLSSPAFALTYTPEEFFKNLSGCFRVTFQFVEDGANDQKFTPVHEYVTLDKKEGTYSLQHFLVPDDQAFKHWREEWSNSGGMWNQKVIGPYEDFRYECSAPMTFNQWRCTAQNAAKSRRDKDRKDYKTLDRENTLQVTPKGWIHAENNTKRDAEGNAVSNELGWNEYERVDEKFCAPAKALLTGPAHF